MEGETQASSAEVEVQLPTKLEVEVMHAFFILVDVLQLMCITNIIFKLHYVSFGCQFVCMFYLIIVNFKKGCECTLSTLQCLFIFMEGR